MDQYVLNVIEGLESEHTVRRIDCNFCELNEIENEIHFILYCPFIMICDLGYSIKSS